MSLLGDALTSVALAFAVLDLTGSATDLGYVFAARTIPLVGFLLVGGVFADRLSRRAVMLTADVTRLGTQGAVALLVLTHNAQVWEIVVLQAISGTASAFFNPASTGLTPMTVSPERLQQANALRGLAQAGTGIVGSALSGVLVVTVGAGWALAIDALTFGVSALFLAQLQLPPHEMLPRQSFLADLHEGWREVVSRTWVWVMIVVSSIVNLMGAVFVVLGATISKQALGGAGAWAAIITSLGVGSLVGGLVALRVNPRYPLRFATSLLGWFAVPMVLVGVHAPVALIAATATLGGAGNLAYNTIWETTLQKHVPAHALSRVSAYDWFGSLAFQPLGLLIAGPAAAVLGASETLYLAAGGTVLMVVVAVATPSVRQLQNTPS